MWVGRGLSRFVLREENDRGVLPGLRDYCVFVGVIYEVMIYGARAERASLSMVDEIWSVPIPILSEAKREKEL